MSLEFQLELAATVLLSIVLSAIVGIDRERSDHPAGLRTHILVGMGSCVFTILSIHAFSGGDTSRVAAQIVSGLGFLGAGAILKDRGRVKGLTTAAGLWSTAAIGMAVGVGAWLLAIIVTVFIWIVLAWLQGFQKHLQPTKDKTQTKQQKDVASLHIEEV